MKPNDRHIAILALVGIGAIAIGLGGAFGWPFGVLTIGAFALFISMVSA